MLIVLCGLPGSGKSTAGRLIAERTSAVILQSDLIRRELFPTRTYSPDESKTVYETMLDRTRVHLLAGDSVILDATFIAVAHRAVPLGLADELGVKSQIVHVVSTAALTAQRLAARQADPSEANYEIYLLLKEQFEAIKIAHILIENVGDLADLQVQVARHFSQQP